MAPNPLQQLHTNSLRAKSGGQQAKMYYVLASAWKEFHPILYLYTIQAMSEIWGDCAPSKRKKNRFSLGYVVFTACIVNSELCRQ
jgi:hypothetical protein